MELKNFIYKTISSIEFATDRVNKKFSLDEDVVRSDINFDIIVDIKDDKIFVVNFENKKGKDSLNRVKFSIKYNPKVSSLFDIAEEAEKKIKAKKGI